MSKGAVETGWAVYGDDGKRVSHIVESKEQAERTMGFAEAFMKLKNMRIAQVEIREVADSTEAAK